MKKLLILLLAALLAQGVWAASGKTAAYTNGFTGDLVFDNEETDQTDTDSNRVTLSGGEFDGNIITGRSKTGSALSNELRIVGGTVSSPSLKAGVSQKADAKNNTVYVRDVTVSANITAGSAAADALDNTVTLSNATVNSNAASDNQVTAGETFTGLAQNNVINVNDGSALNATAAAGYSSSSGEVAYNTVKITGASSAAGAAVYGGYSKEGEVYNNQVSLTDASSVQSDVYGGYAGGALVQRNLVTAQKADISGNVYGGYAAAGEGAADNEVSLGSQTAVSAVVAGGWAASGDAKNNKVGASSGASLAASSEIYGGYAEQGAASGNTVTLKSASAGGKAYGGYGVSGAAEKNSLSVSGATEGGAVLAGGWSESADAAGNTLSVTGSSLTGDFYGGYGANAAGNQAVVSASGLTGNLYGGYAVSGEASGNTASVSGGGKTFSGSVYGGYAQEGNASGNTVELSDVTVTGDVYGGFTASASTETATSNNTVVLSGKTVVEGGFYGGNGAVAEGNKLVLKNYTGSVNSLNAFDEVTLYGLDSNVTFETDVQAGVVVYGKPSEVSQTLAYTPGNSKLSLNRNALGAYSYSIEGVEEGGRTAWNVKGRYDNGLAKTYAQAQLAGLALAAQGDEILASAFDEALTAETENNMFAGVHYYDNAYDTGSGFDMQSAAVQAGRWFKTDGGNVWGLFARYLHGHYSTDPKDATGGIDTFGLGGFLLLPYSETGRFEAVLHGGYQKGDFHSDELFSELDNDGFYGALSAGLVQNVSALELYGKVNWVCLFGDDVHDNLGQSINFKRVQSLNGKIGARWNLGTFARRYKPYIGVAGIYELDGDSSVTVDGHKVSDADLGGLTGQGEVGISYETYGSMMPLKSSLSIFGLTGRTEGWGANIKLVFAF